LLTSRSSIANTYATEGTLRGGDDVELSEAELVRLSKAFFAEIEKKYS
jgi:hypothetical protein